MLISTRSRYGLRALAELGRSDPDEPLSLASIAESELIPVRYLEQIFGKLRAVGIICGRRGPGGGYMLCRPPEEIRLYDVVNVLETDFLPINCLTDSAECGEADENCRCRLEDRCVTKELWEKMRDIYFTILRENTLADLMAGELHKVDLR
ncbi:MAG: Rrf2 family transcriptional regulator [Candidatus Fermentibacteraceae bacterium]